MIIMSFILGRKIEMSQIFDEKGKVIPVTLIEAGPCYITDIKEKDKHGYSGAQLGFIKKIKNIKKTEKGKEFKYLREFKADKEEEINYYNQLGKTIDLSIFKEGEKINISGVSKGKGFQGAVKRWGFAGRGASHGVKHEARTLGSTGGAFPERVIKGRKMPGRMGGEKNTVKNLKIIKIDKENNLLAVRGAVPGKKGALLKIKG